MAGDYDMMDDESAPSEDASVANDSNDTEEKSDETEDQLALVPTSFFSKKSGTPKPGMREMVEVVEVYENEVSIRCVYGDKDDEEESEEEGMGSAPVEAEEDSMMA